MRSGKITRRFLGQVIGAQLAGQALRAEAVTPYPFVDGLSTQSPQLDAAIFRKSGLSGVILDISKA